MGKKRIVEPEDDNQLFENIKRSKLPLTARPGLSERTEYLRQVFQEEESEYTLDWLCARSKPFPMCQVQEFLTSPSNSINELEEQCVKSLTLRPKKNDLYQFSQSDELMKEELPGLPRLAEFKIQINELRQLVTVITGYDVSEVSMFFAEYKYTDHLLTHEDDLQNRVVAFVYYLNCHTWKDSDGGHFETYTSNEMKEPVGTHDLWLPKRNAFNFFKVTQRSHHQVREVLTNLKTRRSLSGWFHTRDALPPRMPLASEEPKYIKKEFNVAPCTIFNEWINPVYLGLESMGRIQTQFEDDSEIQLSDFLKPEKYAELLTYLERSEKGFHEVVPFNRKRTYEFDPSLDSESANPVMQLIEVLNSDDFFLLLSNWTGLKLHPQFEGDESDEDDDEEDDKKREPLGGASRICIRKWKKGNYTLLHDADTNERSSVDLFFHLLPKQQRADWNINNGGFVSYLTKDEDEELLTIAPKANSLSLVFRDQDTLRFVKYLNARCQDDYFYDVFACYYE